MAVFSPNPEDYEFTEPHVFDPEAVFRFNPALEDPRDRDYRYARIRAYNAAAAAATAAAAPGVRIQRPSLFSFNPQPPLFSHFPTRVEPILSATLRSPKLFELVRRSYLYTGQSLRNNWFEEAFKANYKKDFLYTPTQRERLVEFMTAAKPAITLRSRLRRFLHRWRVSRLQAVNTDDIVTCEPPRHPIRIVDWNRTGSQARRQVYVYEASTLAQDIRTRLLNHDGFFEEPMEPRNPLTNLPFTLAQNIAIWIQLTASGTSLATVVSGFRHSRYNLELFDQEFNTVLKLHALRKTMMNPLNGDGIDRLEEFVDLIHSGLRRPTPDRVDNAIWRPYCLRYYEADFLHINHPAMIRRVKADIMKEMIEYGIVKEPLVFPPAIHLPLNSTMYHVRVAPLGAPPPIDVPPGFPRYPAFPDLAAHPGVPDLAAHPGVPALDAAAPPYFPVAAHAAHPAHAAHAAHPAHPDLAAHPALPDLVALAGYPADLGLNMPPVLVNLPIVPPAGGPLDDANAVSDDDDTLSDTDTAPADPDTPNPNEILDDDVLEMQFQLELALTLALSLD